MCRQATLRVTLVNWVQYCLFWLLVLAAPAKTLCSAWHEHSSPRTRDFVSFAASSPGHRRRAVKIMNPSPNRTSPCDALRCNGPLMAFTMVSRSTSFRILLGAGWSSPMYHAALSFRLLTFIQYASLKLRRRHKFWQNAWQRVVGKPLMTSQSASPARFRFRLMLPLTPSSTTEHWQRLPSASLAALSA